MDERHIADVHHGAVHVADWNFVQVIQNFRAAVGRNIVLNRSHLRRARRQDDVLGEDRIVDVRRRQASCVESIRINVNLHHAELAAIGHRDGCALNRDKLSADKTVRKIVEFLFAQLIAAQARQNHRNAGSVVLEDERREDARRQHTNDLLRLRIDLSDCRLDRHVGMEVKTRNGYAA